ncbi:MAG: ThiF family adenylyltransferase [Trichodesmium sp. St16_bin4-tuft]|nr:ThiF family adenylyltransferase [Trichodesmium sp. St5_bin8]MDE5098133.1 ThiF family adenylyltransferase [Trichodesmium sp. St16_bin4-tuft]
MNGPLVYLHQDQLQDVYSHYRKSQLDRFEAVAFCFDEEDVFHVYTSRPKTHLSGYPCASVIKFLTSIPKGEAGLAVATQVSNTISGNKVKSTVIILLAIEQNVLQHCVFIRNFESKFREGVVKFIPDYSELYSRSQGLLETSVLEECKVGIVGLGSGGSTVALELAKAGVSNFVLIDFDRLELGNIARHICGTGDLGRYKTNAVRDLLYGKNPFIKVQTAELDINENLEQTKVLLKDCDLIIAATDNDRSRFNLNNIALEYKIVTIFGRALTRASGGDILRVRPDNGPCLGCIFTKDFLESRQEEVSQFRQARSENPAYVPDDEVKATIQVGLASDILPISNMIVKLALVELSRGKASGISSLEEDLVADFYIWANRREDTYASWQKMEYNFNKPSILRWYGANWKRNQSCPVCGKQTESFSDEDNIFAS